MNHITRNAAALACALSLCATPCTAYAAKTANSSIGPGQAAYARTYYPDTEEAKQALAILTDLYANEADETMGLSEGSGLLLPNHVFRLARAGAVRRIRRAVDPFGGRTADPRHHATGTVL